MKKAGKTAIVVAMFIFLAEAALHAGEGIGVFSRLLQKKLSMERQLSVVETMKEIWKGPLGELEIKQLKYDYLSHDNPEFKQLVNYLGEAACTALEVVGQIPITGIEEVLQKACRRELPCFPSGDYIVWKEDVNNICWSYYDLLPKVLCWLSEPSTTNEPPFFCRLFIKMPGETLSLTERCVSGEVNACWQMANSDPISFLALCNSGNIKYKRALDECESINGTLESEDKSGLSQAENVIEPLFTSYNYIYRDHAPLPFPLNPQGEVLGHSEESGTEDYSGGRNPQRPQIVDLLQQGSSSEGNEDSRPSPLPFISSTGSTGVDSATGTGSTGNPSGPTGLSGLSGTSEAGGGGTHQTQQAGSGYLLESNQSVYFDFDPYETKNVYFHVCSVNGEPPAKLVVSGGIDVVAKWGGSRLSGTPDYPNEDTYRIITGALSEVNGGGCPYRYSGGAGDVASTRVAEEFRDYVYCIDSSLDLKEVRFDAIAEDDYQEEACGWWYVTLYNNSDRRKESVEVKLVVPRVEHEPARIEGYDFPEKSSSRQKGMREYTSPLGSGYLVTANYVKIKPKTYYFFNVAPHSARTFYFYRCVSDQDPLMLLVEVSSNYHYGAPEVIVHYVGDREPTDVRFYPDWGDYFTLADYLFEERPDGERVARMINQCPHDYYSPYTDWYGKVNPEYSEYFYCFGHTLTHTVTVGAPEGTRRCGWWTATLFNILDEERRDVRVWY